jgi:hypothetical protein
VVYRQFWSIFGVEINFGALYYADVVVTFKFEFEMNGVTTKCVYLIRRRAQHWNFRLNFSRSLLAAR